MTTSNGRIRLVVFDMDGTLTRPYLDFGIIRRAVGAGDSDMLTLDYILSLESGPRAEAFRILDRFEEDAAQNAEPREGAAEVLRELRGKGIKTAIFTRNSRKSVETVVAKLGLETDLVVTREDAPPKPAPDAILAMLARWRIEKSEALMVGDFLADVETGRNAGVSTVLLRTDDVRSLDADPDVRIDNLPQLLEVIERWPPR